MNIQNWQEKLTNDGRYFANYDSTTKVWRILDSKHSSVVGLLPDSVLPDNSPAVTILTEGMFDSLIRSARDEGLLSLSSNGPSDATENILLEKEVEAWKDKYEKSEEVLKEQIQNNAILSNTVKELKEKTQIYIPTKHIVDSLLKLAAMEKISDIK